MTCIPVRFPRSCTVECIAINNKKGERGSDPLLTLEHFPCACRIIERIARKRIVAALEHYPVKEIWRDTSQLTEEELRAFAIARHAVARDSEVAREVHQELLCRLHRAIEHGRLNAAAPALYGWIRTAAYRLAKRCAKQAVKNAIASTGVLKFGCGPAIDEGVQLTQVIRRNPRDLVIDALERRPEVAKRITVACREVLLRWLSGEGPGEIAASLGISRVAASLRLMRARRVLVAQ